MNIGETNKKSKKPMAYMIANAISISMTILTLLFTFDSEATPTDYHFTFFAIPLALP